MKRRRSVPDRAARRGLAQLRERLNGQGRLLVDQAGKIADLEARLEGALAEFKLRACELDEHEHLEPDGHSATCSFCSAERLRAFRTIERTGL